VGDWSNFFIGTASAAATLTGLIFVGVSINLTKILSIPKLPGRALISLILLLQILLLSLLFLVPKQTLTTLSIEVLCLSFITWAFVSKTDIGIFLSKPKEFKPHYAFNVLLSQIAIIPYFIGGIEVLTNGENSFYWFVPAILLSFLKAVLDAWVLLVEINR
jgi:hypothetical protein